MLVAQNWPIITSATFYWSAQVIRPSQINGVRKYVPPLDGGNCKVTLQETWIGMGARVNWGQFCNQSVIEGKS